MNVFSIVLILYMIVLALHSAAISLDSQQINIIIKDRYAFTTYLFYFTNTDSNNSSELSYQISLQPHTFISYFFAELNGNIFRGETKEKLEALSEYNKAVDLGLNAVLVSQNHDANIFTIQANVQAGGEATLNVTAERFMLRRFGYYELPLLISNTYDNMQVQFENTPVTASIYDEFSAIIMTENDVIVATNTDYNINEIAPNEYYIDINTPISDQSQELILLRYKTEAMDNNNQLLYDFESSTFMHIFSYEDEDNSALPRRVVFVLDRSGSMGTTKWESAVAATSGALRNLNVDVDKLNIILFDEKFTKYSKSMVKVTDKVIEDSINWIKKYSSAGSTDIYGAVTTGLSLIKNDIDFDKPFEYVNQLILITDGKPTSGVIDPIDIQTGILDANDELKPALASVFCLGIGEDYGTHWVSDLNYPLLRSIATQNDGFDARVKESEIETILSEYYGILKSPVLSFIELNYKTNNGLNTVNSLTQNMFRGLYSGTDIVVCGKTAVGTTAEILVSYTANSGNIKVSDTISMDVSTNNDYYVIDRIWAYLKLKTYRRKLDNPRLSIVDKDLLELGALELSLLYEFVTPWTSMIAVNENEHLLNDTDTDNEDFDEYYYYDINIGVVDKIHYGKSSGYASESIVTVIVVVGIIVILVISVIVFICYYNKKRGKTAKRTDSKKTKKDYTPVVPLQLIKKQKIVEDTNKKSKTYGKINNDSD